MKKTFTFLAIVFCAYSNAQIISTFAGNGGNGFGGDGGLATSATLKNPTGVAVDAQGNVYISDSYNSRIRKVDACTGNITTVVGSGSYGFAGDGGLATAASMTYPIDVALDSQGNLYIADNANYRIRKVTKSTGIITTIAGNGSSTPSGDGGLATAAQLQMGQMAFDAQDNLYISANNSIRKITASTGIITTVAGTGVAGYSGDGGAATAAELYATGGLVIDGNGNIYISDQGNHRVRKVTASTGIITTIVGTGVNNYFGDGGLATAAEITGPYGLALDSQNNLYIADQSNHRIRKVDATTSIISTIAGNGNGNYSGDGGPATSAELFFPGDLAIDAQNSVYITEGYALSSVHNYRVRKISNGTASGIEQFDNNKDQITIYPNPSTGMYNFHNKEVIQNVKIFDVQGSLILNKEIKSFDTSIDLSGNASGLYFYQITNEKNQLLSGKIILQ